MKYLICKRQAGEGCDYTIGCGAAFGYVEADSIEDAQEKVVYPDGRDEYCRIDGENALVDILIIPAEHVFSVDVKKLVAQHEKREKQREKTEVEDEERRELERLQNKYK